MDAQFGDRIVIDGKPCRLGCEPGLAAHLRIVERTPEEADASNPRTTATSCWRGDVVEWCIEGGRLYLTGITGRYRLTDGPPLFADWVSGTLAVPTGKIVEYLHRGYQTRTEGRLERRISEGVVLGLRETAIETEPARRPRAEDSERSIFEILPIQRQGAADI
ncbi:hypothetical protein [Rubrivivax albus]|uniref:Uncharacterized protein n=1 Tax=Rubrivivax albus TaxID=2499835 RepID=A0A3S2WTE1_9BURK|nr:hypothetical protein [Rubrivivax albus]RVT50356.1 hypothetical protein ENE75_15160 [Rubrivivax albus]